jgi:hypothetical protein
VCSARIAARKNTAYVPMSETAVDEVITPIRNANAMRAAIVKRITAPDRRKRGW